MKIGNLLKSSKAKMGAGVALIGGSSFVAQAEDYDRTEAFRFSFGTTF